jgi:hypothetical protein
LLDETETGYRGNQDQNCYGKLRVGHRGEGDSLSENAQCALIS